MSIPLVISNFGSAGSNHTGVPLFGSLSSASCATRRISLRPADQKIVASTPHRPPVLVIISILLLPSSSSVSPDVYLALGRHPSRPSALELCSHVSATLSAAACTAFAIPLPAIRPPHSAAAKTKIRMSQRIPLDGKRRAPPRKILDDRGASRMCSPPREYQCLHLEAPSRNLILPRGNRPVIRARHTPRNRLSALSVCQ